MTVNILCHFELFFSHLILLSALSSNIHRVQKNNLKAGLRNPAFKSIEFMIIHLFSCTIKKY